MIKLYFTCVSWIAHLPTVTDLPAAPSEVAWWAELLLLETTAPAVAITDELDGCAGLISWLCL